MIRRYLVRPSNMLVLASTETWPIMVERERPPKQSRRPRRHDDCCLSLVRLSLYLHFVGSQNRLKDH
jgi:hypothetical protein